MNLAAQSGMLAAFVSAAVALSVLLRNRKPLVNRLFVLFAGNLFVHFLASFFHRFSESAGWLKVDLFSVNLLPVTSLLFFSHFLWKGTEVTRPYLRLMLGCSVVGTAMLLLLPAQHPLLVYFIICFAFTGLYICVWLFHLRRRELRSEREKTRLKILQLVMLVAVTFVLLGMLPASFGFLRTWGDLVSVFFLYFLSQGLIRYRLLDLQELLGRGLVLIAIALILAIVFGLLVLLAGAAPPVSLFHTFVASFIILILFEPLRDKVEDSAGLLLFRERFELRRQLQQLRRSIANIIDVEAMAAVMLDTLYENLKLAGSSIYLREEAADSFQLLAFRGPRPPESLVRNSHPQFFEQLERTPTVILAESFERVLEQHGISADEEVPDKVRHAGKVLDTLHRLRAGICLPLVVQGRVLGLWNILDESGTASYSSDEIALFMAVAEQAAIKIAT
ncbi:MAG: GAF domain-containing protein [Deltaproteobacteria bacterium]|nr:MAG: GAF domain-containing protein [Deltaproteobacteria bacterium]